MAIYHNIIYNYLLKKLEILQMSNNRGLGEIVNQ